jgi:arylsulfatase A-like enzyme
MRRFLRAIILVSGIFFIQCANSPSNQRSLPNIVIIFTDDQGYGDVVTFGATDFATPNLDRMAYDGMRFTHFYCAQAVCSASRAALLTGCYPNRIGIAGALFPYSTNGIHADEMTIGELVKQQNYATAIFGKWHLGHHQKFLPLQHGFDEYFGLPYSNDMWPVDYSGEPVADDHRKSRFPPLPLIDGNEKVEEVSTLDNQNLLTQRYTERALEFIRSHKENPFFLYLAHSMPHVPLGVSSDYSGASKQGMYGDVIMDIDWSVGEVLRTLEELGIAENTLVVFTTDNGPWLNFGNHAGSTGGLREGKGTSFEGGQRVPCIMKWPGVIPAGRVCDRLSSTIDLFPTIAEITGADMPEHYIDGISILGLMRGEDVNPRTQFYYYYGVNNLEAVRKDNWKLVLEHPYDSYEGLLPGNDGFPGPRRRDTSDYALYNLRRDPGERYDVKDLYPDVVREIELIVEQAREDLGDNLTGREGKRVREAGQWISEENQN